MSVDADVTVILKSRCKLARSLLVQINVVPPDKRK